MVRGNNHSCPGPPSRITDHRGPIPHHQLHTITRDFPTPTAKFSTLGQATTTAAHHEQTDVTHISHLSAKNTTDITHTYHFTAKNISVKNNVSLNTNLSSNKYSKYKNKAARKRKQTKKENQKLLNKQKYITNLSSKTLTPPQVDVLSLGLPFVPSRSGSRNQLPEPLKNFERSNRLKDFFSNKQPATIHPFKGKSLWTPPPASPEIEAYLKRIKSEVNALSPLKTTPNLTPSQNKALQKLSSDPTLVIKSADKGSGIVVEDTTQYVKDGLDHLPDKTIYEEIKTDPTESLSKAMNTYVDKIQKDGIMTKSQRNTSPLK